MYKQPDYYNNYLISLIFICIFLLIYVFILEAHILKLESHLADIKFNYDLLSAKVEEILVNSKVSTTKPTGFSFWKSK